jgi:predicted patatin/cPLA2 family phospholipase
MEEKTLPEIASGKIACVLSSGGMRGAYQLGVLKAMEERKMVFDLMVGASVGAMNAMRYVAEQIDVYMHVWLEHCTGRQLIDPRRALRLTQRRPVFDLDYMLGDAIRDHEIDTARIDASPTEVQVAITAYPSLKTEFKKLTGENVIPLLTATAAMPYVSGGPVYLEGQRYLDGGLTAPVPVQPALESKCETIYVLCVRSEEEVQADARLGYFQRSLRPFMTPLQKSLIDRRVKRARIHKALSDDTYQATGKKIVFLRPNSRLPVGRFTADKACLQKAIDIGYQDALDHL